MRGDFKGDACKNRHRGAANSFLANLRVGARKPSQRERIYLSLLDSRGTCEEISVRTGIRYTSCSARIAELKAITWVRESGERRRTSGGEWADVLRALTAEERRLLLRPYKPYSGRQRNLFEATA